MESMIRPTGNCYLPGIRLERKLGPRWISEEIGQDFVGQTPYLSRLNEQGSYIARTHIKEPYRAGTE